MNLDEYLALPDEEKKELQSKIISGELKVKDFPARNEFNKYRKVKSVAERIKKGICPWCGRSNAKISPRPLDPSDDKDKVSYGMRRIWDKPWEASYWECGGCTGAELARILTGGSEQIKNIKSRKQREDGSIEYLK